MVDRSDFYGQEANDLLTFLEFGSIDIKSQYKRTWGFALHQDAYDIYMLARYMRDLILFRDVIGSAYPTRELLVEKVASTAHKDLSKLVLKYAAVLTARELDFGGGRYRLCELGSTLFGFIDEVLAVSMVIKHRDVEDYVKAGYYRGLEISSLQNRGAEELHRGYDLDLVLGSSVERFVEGKPEYDVFYGYGITWQYVVKSPDDLICLCAPSRLSIVNQITFSRGETASIRLGTGKIGHNVSFLEFADKTHEALGLSIFYQPTVLDLGADDILKGTFIVADDTTMDCFRQHGQDISTAFREVTSIGV